MDKDATERFYSDRRVATQHLISVLQSRSELDKCATCSHNLGPAGEESFTVDCLFTTPTESGIHGVTISTSLYPDTGQYAIALLGSTSNLMSRPNLGYNCFKYFGETCETLEESQDHLVAEIVQVMNA